MSTNDQQFIVTMMSSLCILVLWFCLQGWDRRCKKLSKEVDYQAELRERVSEELIKEKKRSEYLYTELNKTCSKLTQAEECIYILKANIRQMRK